MSQFKIRRKEVGGKCSAEYLSEERRFSFNNQSSEPNPEFTLYPGTIVDLEFDAVGGCPEVGAVVDLEGAFYNFTKRTPTPDLVFCVTKIN